MTKTVHDQDIENGRNAALAFAKEALKPDCNFTLEEPKQEPYGPRRYFIKDGKDTIRMMLVYEGERLVETQIPSGEKDIVTVQRYINENTPHGPALKRQMRTPGFLSYEDAYIGAGSVNDLSWRR